VPELGFRVERLSGATLFRVEGEVDISSASSLAHAVEDAERHDAPLLVLDLADVRFIDLEGIRVLDAARRRAASADRELILILERSGGPRKVLALFNLLERYEVWDATTRLRHDERRPHDPPAASGER
jgi:anti-anti-sigma factor